MKSIVFKIKTITPTFMGGGDSRLDRIRTSEIKGMMRWWFRALAGGVVGDDINRLRGLEGTIFGATESKSNSCKSMFKILLANLNLKFLQGQFDSSGFTYLGIGNVIFKYDKNKFIPNPDKSNSAGNTLIDANSTFDVKLSFYPKTNEDDINLIAGSFYLATALGGFGLRARKCFGSCQIETCDGLDLRFNPTVYTEEGIKENINRLREIIKSKFNNRTPASQYPSLDDYQFIFSVIRTNEVNYKELLDKFGRLYRGFRICAENPQPGLPGRGIHTSDFDFLRKATSAQNCKEVDFSNYKIRNALFGLNIVYPQLGNKKLQLEHIRDNKDNDKQVLRRASPVWFSVKEINGKLNLHITLFKSQFKPDGSSVKFDGRVVEIEDYSLIEQKFIPYIKQELEDKNG